MLTSTCAPPSTRQRDARLTSDIAGHQHQHEGVHQPRHAHVGIDAESGVISAPARAASPAPIENVTKRTSPLLMPSPRARFSFMITARVCRPSRVARAARSDPPRPATDHRQHHRISRYCE